ncbi:hypothetical protein [Pedobacter gandavensis]|uniref:hypothetical protein n=1 Tax=Pedobacter gandavensis TaxID=2679963 RepID=UPI00292F77A3|nr:hypothetical protein [Pedobacter gandavensis]
MFFQLLIAIILGFSSPSTTNDDGTPQNNPTDVPTNGDPVTGGDMGQNPPPK